MRFTCAYSHRFQGWAYFVVFTDDYGDTVITERDSRHDHYIGQAV